LYPTNLDDWYTGNEIFIEFECEYEIEEGYKEFKVEAYNSDDFYDHTPIVGFNVLRLAAGLPPTELWIEG